MLPTGSVRVQYTLPDRATEVSYPATRASRPGFGLTASFYLYRSHRSNAWIILTQ